MCVQNFDDSRGFAIRITYRISLRSSSLWEPRHPLLKVVCHFFYILILIRIKYYVLSESSSSIDLANTQSLVSLPDVKHSDKSVS